MKALMTVTLRRNLSRKWWILSQKHTSMDMAATIILSQWGITVFLRGQRLPNHLHPHPELQLLHPIQARGPGRIPIPGQRARITLVCVSFVRTKRHALPLSTAATSPCVASALISSLQVQENAPFVVRGLLQRVDYSGYLRHN